MPIDKPDYQLSFELDVAEEDSDRSALGVEEVRMRSETARQALEGAQALPWLEEYERLRNGGWPWRVAAYIAWASQPRNKRLPKTQDELARGHLGLTSDRAINTWRKKNPAIDEMTALLQVAPLWDFRADVFDALKENAVKADYKTHNDRKLFLELTGDYIPTAKLAAMLSKGNVTKEDLSAYSDEELAILYRQLVSDMQADKEKKE